VSDTLTYSGIASEAVFTDPHVAEWFKLSYYTYWRDSRKRLANIQPDYLHNDVTILSLFSLQVELAPHLLSP